MKVSPTDTASDPAREPGTLSDPRLPSSLPSSRPSSSSSSSPAHFLIVGTDTGVGKTYVACALIHALRQSFPERRIAAMKPVAAGVRDDGRHEDVERLVAAANLDLPMQDVAPYRFALAAAPAIAAQEEGVRIDLAVIARRFAALAATADHVVVEGVGGFRVPLGDAIDGADMAVTLALPVILVVGLRLGCINHALLTAEAIERRGLTLAGWVANTIDPAMSHIDANVEALRARLPAPLLAHLPHAAPGEVASPLMDDVGGAPEPLRQLQSALAAMLAPVPVPSIRR